MTETARMYGGSLYDLAAEEGLDERILGELDGVTAICSASPASPRKSAVRCWTKPSAGRSTSMCSTL